MGKISSEAKKRYFEKVKEYKNLIDKIQQREKNILQVANNDDDGGSYQKINLSEERMNLASYYLLLNQVSLSLLGVKNEAFLNDARKSCYQALIYLEEVVSNYLDAPISEYREMLDKVDGLEDEKRYLLVRKLGFTIQSVEDGFGDNSKWRWSFVELEGRLATVAKNILNYKTIVSGMDPRVEGYEARLGHLKMVKQLMQKSADRYREKYELSTSRIDDFKLAISYLAALRRLHIILGESENAEIVKKKADVWKAKMEADEKKLSSATG